MDSFSLLFHVVTRLLLTRLSTLAAFLAIGIAASRTFDFLVRLVVPRDTVCHLLATNLIFAFELHHVALSTAYFFETSSRRIFAALSLIVALYYFVAWKADYTGSQYLAAHFVRLPVDFFSPVDLTRTKGDLVASYAVVAAEIACVFVLFTPLSGHLLGRTMGGDCARDDVECLLCHQYHDESAWLTAVLEFTGAFFVGWVVSSFREMSLVMLALLFRLLIHSVVYIFGIDLVFIHVIPATSITIIAFCWEDLRYQYALIHWLSPLLGSFFAWLFFHQQQQQQQQQHSEKLQDLKNDVIIKTSVSSLAKVQSQDTIASARGDPKEPLKACSRSSETARKCSCLICNKNEDTTRKEYARGVCGSRTTAIEDLKNMISFKSSRPPTKRRTGWPLCNQDNKRSQRRFVDFDECECQCQNCPSCIPCNFHNNNSTNSSSSSSSSSDGRFDASSEESDPPMLTFHRLKSRVKKAVGSLIGRMGLTGHKIPLQRPNRQKSRMHSEGRRNHGCSGSRVNGSNRCHKRLARR